MKRCPDIDEVKVPWMIEKLLDNGYVVWFVDGRSSSRNGGIKIGQQFWLEDGELVTHNVHPYHRKETRKGWHAWRTFERELESYSQCRFSFTIVGDDPFHFHYYVGDFSDRSLRDTINHAIKYVDMPMAPAHVPDYDLIENITPDTIITFHKRKQTNTSAFRAGDAKAVVFKWLQKRYKDAVIVPEFGIGSGIWNKDSIVDLAAFDKKKIIFVEIKAETDTFARVKNQLVISSQIADEVWLALFENKHIPNDIPLHIGIILFDKNGKIKLHKKPHSLKQDKKWIGHIWTTEFHENFAAYKGSSYWMKNLCRGVEELTKVAADILGTNSRQFTINVWRRRHFEEFIWRRDLLTKGDTNVMSIGRGKKGNVSSSYFFKNYNYEEHGLHESGLKDLAKKNWTPPMPARKKKESTKNRIMRLFEQFKAKNRASA